MLRGVPHLSRQDLGVGRLTAAARAHSRRFRATGIAFHATTACLGAPLRLQSQFPVHCRLLCFPQLQSLISFDVIALEAVLGIITYFATSPLVLAIESGAVLVRSTQLRLLPVRRSAALWALVRRSMADLVSDHRADVARIGGNRRPPRRKLRLQDSGRNHYPFAALAVITHLTDLCAWRTIRLGVASSVRALRIRKHNRTVAPRNMCAAMSFAPYIRSA